MKELFRWQLKIGSASYRVANPIWNDGVALQTALATDQKFHRTALDGTLLFTHTDFDDILAAPMDTEFRVILQKQQPNNTFQTIQPTFRFWKTDCEFEPGDNAERRQVRVALTPYDIYEDILNGMDKEFNLIELEPPTVEVTYRRQAVLQVYFYKTGFIMNYTDGMFWESPIDTLPNHADILAAGFGTFTGYNTPTDGLFNHARVLVTGGNSGQSPDATGLYRCRSYTPNGFPNVSFDRVSDGKYRLEKNSNASFEWGQIVDLDIGPTTIVYKTDNQALGWPLWGEPPHAVLNDYFRSYPTPGSSVGAYEFIPYVRLLTNKTDVGGDPTVALADDDPFNKGVFTHALPIETDNFLYSEGHSSDPTRWGKFAETVLHWSGMYFTRPASPNGKNVMPVLPSTWTGASAWFYFDDTLLALAREAGETITLYDGYKLSDVISKLLQAVGSAASHDDGEPWSDFLYAASNAIRGSRKVPVITQITNVTVGNYDKPAQKAPIRLGDVVNLIKGFYHGGWHVGGENNFIVEVEPYYRNGRSYDGPVVGADLTQYVEPKRGLPWSFGTNKFSYEKQNLPERMEFSWANPVSRPFEGYPIDMLSGFVEKGRVEKIILTRFTSDLDYLHVSPSSVSTDGFVFFECVEDSEGRLSVPFVDFEVGPEESYKMQNGYASMLWAHDKYWRHEMPCPSLRINTNLVTASSVVRSKLQGLTMPLIDTFDVYELITSAIGDCQVVSLKKNLSSGASELQVKGDN